MKKMYEQPQMYAELFVANHYCAACKDPQFKYEVAPMDVRCQTEGHLNIAKDQIFFDVEGSACDGKFDENSGSYVEGVWDVNRTWFGFGNEVEWFYENTNDDNVVDKNDDKDLGDKVFNTLVTAFKGFFRQGGNQHLFYAKVDKISEYNIS